MYESRPEFQACPRRGSSPPSNDGGEVDRQYFGRSAAGGWLSPVEPKCWRDGEGDAGKGSAVPVPVEADDDEAMEIGQQRFCCGEDVPLTVRFAATSPPSFDGGEEPLPQANPPSSALR
jgi:hypothetical protein